MPHKHTPPASINSPQDLVSNIHVLFDGGTTNQNHFSVVKMDWDGSPCFAIRWNVSEKEWDDPDKQNGSKDCVGLPVSHGKPVWFVLPDALLDTNSDVWNEIKEKLKEFGGNGQK